MWVRLTKQPSKWGSGSKRRRYPAHEATPGSSIRGGYSSAGSCYHWTAGSRSSRAGILQFQRSGSIVRNPPSTVAVPIREVDNHLLYIQRMHMPSISAKVFKSGNSQAIRLPKALRLNARTVLIEKTARGLFILIPEPRRAASRPCPSSTDPARTSRT